MAEKKGAAVIEWQTGIIDAIVEAREDFQLLRIVSSEAMAVNYPLITGKAFVGDRVILNTTAVKLTLGTGGVHFVAHILSPSERESSTSSGSLPFHSHIVPSTPAGHIMKLRYTPFQLATLSCEEESSPYHALFQDPEGLFQTPVLVGELHSMLPILVTVLRHLLPTSARIIYVMSDGGALPIALSRHVQKLKELEWLQGTVTYGHAFGGDLEAVNVYTALLAAKHVLQADVILLMMGPGIVGTNTPWGFSGMEVAEMIHAVWTLQGLPFFVPRVSSGDQRRRHQGISHHTQLLLQRGILSPTLVPLPAELAREAGLAGGPNQVESRHLYLCNATLPWVEIRSVLTHYPRKIRSMGRSMDEDTLYFYTVGHAAAVVWEWLRGKEADDIHPIARQIRAYLHAQTQNF